MYRPSRTVMYSIIVVLAFSFLVLHAQYTFAESCPTGTVAITSATRPTATAAGIPESSQCWNPSDTNAGQDAGGAKQFLQQHATTNANISCLNADFAEKVAKLMKAVPGGVPTIRDAYRSPQQQADLPAGSTNAGPCQSYHQYGQAADFNASPQTLHWMRSNASQYGLAPVSPCAIATGSTCSGSLVDPGHIQIDGGHSGQCGVCSSSGKGGYGVLPSEAGSGGGAPSAGLSNSLRESLGGGGGQQQGGGQPQPQSPPQSSPSTPQQPTSADGMGAENPQNKMNPPNSISDILKDQALMSTINATSATSTSTSSYDILSQFIYGTSSAHTTAQNTNTPTVALNQNIFDTSLLNQPTTLYQVITYPTSTIIGNSQSSTFGNGGLSEISSDYSPTSPAIFSATIEAIRAQLDAILIYLKPFRGDVPHQQYLE